MKCVPISKIIFSKHNDGLNTDTDVVLMKIPILDTLIAKVQPEANKLAQDILNTPYMKKQIRLNKRRTPEKALAKTMGSSFYKNLRKHQEQKILNLVDMAYTEDLRFCVFNLKNNHNIKTGDVCVSLGIPNSDFGIDYNQNTIHSLILGTKCVFKGFDANRQDYMFEYTDTDNLNGMSGGPIIYKDSVIAVQHSIEKGKIYATPITTEFIRKAEMA